MKKLAIVIFTVVTIFPMIPLLCSNTISNIRSDEENGVIQWSFDRKLTVNDFTRTSMVLPHNAAAISCTGIYMDKCIGEPGYKAYAVFVKAGSWWYLKSNVNPNIVLRHEQLHFDITHYMAIQLNKKLREPQYHRQDRANDAYEVFNYRLDSLQKLYDEETDHARRFAIQVAWEAKIDSLFEELEKSIKDPTICK